MSNISSVLSQSGLLGSADTTPAGSITATQLASDSVTTAKILNSNVTTAKIADLNVTSGKLAAGAVTVGKLGQSVMIPYSASGLASAGAITTTGTKVGDKVLAVIGFVTSSSVWVGLNTTNFEATVTIADQIQQSSGALSANTYIFLVQPQS